MKHYNQNYLRNRDNHFRTDDVEYELMSRVSFDQKFSISELTRQLWFANGWEKRLAQLRKKHRQKGFPDALFLHPQIKKVLSQSNGHNG